VSPSLAKPPNPQLTQSSNQEVLQHRSTNHRNRYFLSPAPETAHFRGEGLVTQVARYQLETSWRWPVQMCDTSTCEQGGATALDVSAFCLRCPMVFCTYCGLIPHIRIGQGFCGYSIQFLLQLALLSSYDHAGDVIPYSPLSPIHPSRTIEFAFSRL
jgi:hypothetical protein